MGDWQRALRSLCIETVPPIPESTQEVVSPRLIWEKRPMGLPCSIPLLPSSSCFPSASVSFAKEEPSVNVSLPES